MKVHLIKKHAIEDFTSKHARSSKSFQIWLAILKHADWENPATSFKPLDLPICWEMEVTA